MKYIIGIDEVGRGTIAGPVAVGVFYCTNSDGVNEIIKEAKKKFNLPIRDSKKLTRNQREKWFKYLNECKKESKCDFNVSFVASEMIDKFGIKKCIQKALDKSLEKIISPEILFEKSSDERGRRVRPYQKEIQASFIYLDGGLYAPKKYINQKTIIKGDESHPIISLASIVAKVSRDRIMYKYGIKYPNYGFENHVGYGTKAHYEAIKKYGQISIHRKTFIHH